ncbi:MAG: hypothetical protein SGCHY_000870 [Lobulomycetales sp.]
MAEKKAEIAIRSSPSRTLVLTNEVSSLPPRFRQDPVRFLLNLGSESHAFINGSDVIGFEDYVGARVIYPEYTMEIRKALLGSTRVRNAVAQLAQASKVFNIGQPFMNDQEEDMEKTKHKLWKQSIEIVNQMIAEMDSMRKLRVFAYMVTNSLTRMYHQGIHINEEEFFLLRKWAVYAQERKMSLIFLPSHKSHIDYLVISYVFFRLGIALPHIAAGENLNLPVIGNLLKACGAFFIRRSWGNDLLYTSVMREYIEILLERGHNIEAFIEGTRSRMGKLLQPKFGILKIILESIINNGRIKDCIIVPMSIGYDKVIESSAYVSELLGTPKQKESLYQLMSNFNIASLKWGRIDVRFAAPFSLLEYIQKQETRRGSKFSPKTVASDRDLLLQGLGFKVLSEINFASVGTWGMSTAEIVDKSIPILKDLVSIRQDLIEPIFSTNNRLDPNLKGDIAFLSSLLKTEFVFSAGGLDRNIHETLQGLVDSDVLCLEAEAGEPGQAFVEHELKWVSLSSEERRIGREHFDFYCFLLWPFIETYWLTAVSTFSLFPDRNDDHSSALSWVDEKVFMNRCQFLGKSLYYEGDLSYLESVNLETIKNAVLRLKELGIVKTKKSRLDGSDTVTTWITLESAYMPPPLPSVEGRTPSGKSSKSSDPEKDYLQDWYNYKPSGTLWDFCEKIGQYRREGKNRRDTQTVATRVLRLSRVSSKWVDGKWVEGKKPSKL